MPKRNQDLTGENALPIGDDFSFTIDVSDIAPASSVTAATWRVAKDPARDPVIALSLAAGDITVDDQSPGILLTVTVPAASSALLSEGLYRHQAEVTDAGGAHTVTVGELEAMATL